MSQVTNCTYYRLSSSEDVGYVYQNGNWKPLILNGTRRTFPIAAGITYGAYTYNLDRNGERIASELTTASYNDPNRNNAASYYTVTANYFGGESTASNGVGYTFGQGSLNSLELRDNDRMTVTENSILTVTGSLSNDNPENLIIETGAQLIHNSADVKATVKKTIAAYETDEDGWKFIASQECRQAFTFCASSTATT